MGRQAPHHKNKSKEVGWVGWEMASNKCALRSSESHTTLGHHEIKTRLHTLADLHHSPARSRALGKPALQPCCLLLPSLGQGHLHRTSTWSLSRGRMVGKLIKK